MEPGGAVMGVFFLGLYTNLASHTCLSLSVCLHMSECPRVQFLDKCLEKLIQKGGVTSCVD